MNTDNLTMTIPEVAKALGISRGLAYQLASQDKLGVKVLKFGRRLLVSRRAVEDLLAGRQSESQAVK